MLSDERSEHTEAEIQLPQVLTCSHLNPLPGTSVFSMPYKEVVLGWLGQILEMEKAIRESLKVHLFLGG